MKRLNFSSPVLWFWDFFFFFFWWKGWAFSLVFFFFWRERPVDLFVNSEGKRKRILKVQFFSREANSQDEGVRKGELTNELLVPLLRIQQYQKQTLHFGPHPFFPICPAFILFSLSLRLREEKWGRCVSLIEPYWTPPPFSLLLRLNAIKTWCESGAFEVCIHQFIYLSCLSSRRDVRRQWRTNLISE